MRGLGSLEPFLPDVHFHGGEDRCRNARDTVVCIHVGKIFPSLLGKRIDDRIPVSLAEVPDKPILIDDLGH